MSLGIGIGTVEGSQICMNNGRKMLSFNSLWPN